MIEKKLNVGEFIEFGDIAEARYMSVEPKEVSVGAQPRTILMSQKIGGIITACGAPVVRDTEPGENKNPKKEHRNFIWLPFAQNAINYVESAGKDVLSGKFSGCYMIQYTFKSSRRVAHVATPEAKAEWNRIAALPDYVIERGFVPVMLKTEIPPTLAGENPIESYGLITETGDLFTIFLAPQRDGGSMTKILPHRRIAGVVRQESLPLASLTKLQDAPM